MVSYECLWPVIEEQMALYVLSEQQEYNYIVDISPFSLFQAFR